MSFRHLLRAARVAALGLIGPLAILAAPYAAAATPPGESAAPCGVTIDAKLAAARAALQEDDKTARKALTCLVEALGTLNDRVLSDEQSRPLFKANIVPAVTLPPNP